MITELTNKVQDFLRKKIKPALDDGFELYMFNVTCYGWTNDIRIYYGLIRNTKNEESLLYDSECISLSVKPDPDGTTNIINDIIIDYLKEYDFIIFKSNNNCTINIININYIKPSISGKYKTNLRLNKSIKGITNYENGYWFDRFNVSFGVVTLTSYKDKNSGIYKAKVTNQDHQKIVSDIIAKADKCIENYNSITLGDIIMFRVSSNRNGLTIENIRGEDGCGISLDMLPDPKIMMKKATECMDSDDYIFTTGHIYVNFKKILSDEYNLNVISNQYSPDKYIRAENIKNNIDSNAIILRSDDFDKMMEKSNIDSDLEEKIISYKLLLEL